MGIAYGQKAAVPPLAIPPQPFVALQEVRVQPGFVCTKVVSHQYSWQGKDKASTAKQTTYCYTSTGLPKCATTWYEAPGTKGLVFELVEGSTHHQLGYDSLGRIIEEEYLYHDGTTWAWEDHKSYVKRYRYYGSDSVDVVTFQVDSSRSAMPVKRTIFEQNAMGALLSETQMVYETNQWKITHKMLVVYDDSLGRQEAQFTFKQKEGHIDRNLQYELGYDEAGRLVEKYCSIWDGAAWQLYQKEALTYELNEVSTIEGYLREPAGEGWALQTIEKRSYDEAGRLLEVLYQGVLNEEVKPISRVEYRYDKHGNLIKELEEVHQFGWKQSRLVRYTYAPVGSAESMDGVLVE